MIIRLDEFKQKRPNIAPLFDYIERVVESEMRLDTYSHALPYPENIDRFTRLFLPMLAFPIGSEDFKRVLTFYADWIETFHFQYPSIVMANFMAHNVTKFYERVAEGVFGVDAVNDKAEMYNLVTTFLLARTVEAAHLGWKGPTIAYHPDLFTMLSLTDADKLTNVPITSLAFPYKSLYLDWKDCPHKLGDNEGLTYQGCYVQARVVSWSDMEKFHIIEADKSIVTAMEKGVIREGTDVLFLDMLFTGQSDNPDKIQSNLFSIAASLEDDLSIKDTVFTAEETQKYDFAGMPMEHMKQAIAMVINSLLYMSAKQSVREEMKEMAGMEKKILNIKNPAKKRKALARIQKNTYDYVRIGKSYELRGEFTKDTDNEGKKQEPHIRLGFFNTFYSGDRVRKDELGNTIKDCDGRSIPVPTSEQSKEVKWIKPYLVNAESLADIPVKNRKML